MKTSPLSIMTKLVSDLSPAPYNPRSISEDALTGLRASVERFGLVEPIVWNSQTCHVVGGHQRLKVLQALGEVETQVVVVDLPEVEEKALNVALNSPSIAGEFTPELHTLIAEIEASMPELADQLRYDDLAAELKHLLSDLAPEEGLTSPDDVPETPEDPITCQGDLYILGGHRLICGDSKDASALTRLMDGQTAALYMTDPPYGVGYDGTNHPQNRKDKEAGKESGTQNRDWSDDYQDLDAWDHFRDAAEFEQFLVDVFKTALPHVAENAAWYTWHASATNDCFRKAWAEAGVRYHQMIQWIKPTFVLGFAMWNYRSEPCLMGWRQGHKPCPYSKPHPPLIRSQS